MIYLYYSKTAALDPCSVESQKLLKHQSSNFSTTSARYVLLPRRKHAVTNTQVLHWSWWPHRMTQASVRPPIITSMLYRRISRAFIVNTAVDACAERHSVRACADRCSRLALHRHLSAHHFAKVFHRCSRQSVYTVLRTICCPFRSTRPPINWLRHPFGRGSSISANSRGLTRGSSTLCICKWIN